eukprot:s3083_g12.t1
MRNPRKAVQCAPGWQVWGAKASAALDEVLASSPQASWLAERVGADMRPDEVEAAQHALRELGSAGARALASVTHKAEGWEQVGPTGWRWALVRAITDETKDLDVDISTWLQGKTPLGISESIVPRGVFLPAQQTKAQLESAEFLALRGTEVTVDRNYRSFHEHELESAYELERLTAEGHLEVIGTWEEVIARWPDARATKLATLVKERPDGTTKTRFISDMRRSGINGMAQAKERITLPRGCDLVRDTLDLVETCGGDLEYFTADFSDAFLNLGIAEAERGYAVVRTTTDAYAAYRGVPFGLATAPLLWGRTSAWIGRATQSLHQEWESRLQIYVDYPVCLVSGTPRTRSHRIAKILAFWASLGARIALHKAARGPEIKWIGAVFGIVPGGVRVSIDKERIHKLQATVRRGLAETGLVHGVRSLAGELSWVAGIVPTIRPFTNMIWAATYAMEGQDHRAKQGASKARIRPRDAVFAKMIKLPLQWLQRFLDGHHGGLQRVRRVWDRTAFPQWYVRTDASTTGLGGILLDAKGRPVRWWASPIPAQALAHLKIVTGEPGLMTTYELLALLFSVINWTPFLRLCRLRLMVQLDSESALYVAAKLASPHPKANLVAAELALRAEQLGVEAILGQHWPNYINTEADALSRLAEGQVVPPRLRHLPPPSAHGHVPARPRHVGLSSCISAPKGGRVRVCVHVFPQVHLPGKHPPPPSNHHPCMSAALFRPKCCSPSASPFFFGEFPAVLTLALVLDILLSGLLATALAQCCCVGPRLGNGRQWASPLPKCGSCADIRAGPRQSQREVPCNGKRSGECAARAPTAGTPRAAEQRPAAKAATAPGPADAGGQEGGLRQPDGRHAGKRGTAGAGHLRLGTAWRCGAGTCCHVHEQHHPDQEVWDLGTLFTAEGLWQFLRPLTALSGRMRHGTEEGEKAPAGAPPPPKETPKAARRGEEGSRKPERRPEESGDGDDDPEESPPPADYGDKLGMPDYGPICCGCGRGGCVGLQHKQALDHPTMITRRVGGAGSPRIGICLAPARQGALRPPGSSRRLCGHTPCEQCVVWTQGAPMCPCCANRTRSEGPQLQGAGPLPEQAAQDRHPIPAVAGAGRPPRQAPKADPTIRRSSASAAPRGADLRERRAPTPAGTRGASARRDERAGDRGRSRTPASSRRPTGRTPSPARPDESDAPDVGRSGPRAAEEEESSEEEDVAEEDDSEREGYYRNLPAGKDDRRRGATPEVYRREEQDRRECMNPHCERPARGSDEVCCTRCTETRGWEHTYNCDMRTRAVRGDGGTGGGDDRGKGPPDPRDRSWQDRGRDGQGTKPPSKANRDRDRHMTRKGGKGKARPAGSTHSKHVPGAYRRALSLAVAVATSRSRVSRLRTWGKVIDTLEAQELIRVEADRRRLDPTRLKAVTAYLRAQGYRSAELYASTAMMRHKAIYPLG